MKKVIEHSDNTGVKGLHKFVFCKPITKIAKELEEKLSHSYSINFAQEVINHIVQYKVSYKEACFIIAEKQKQLWEEYQYYLREFKKACFTGEIVYENIIPTAGRTVLAQRLANNTTYTGIINYGALGSGGATPANGNTTLGTETYRKATSSQTSASNISYITNFYTSTETSGTYAEAGWFIDGTASANTGQLFSRFLISVTKSVTETLTVESTFTFS